MSKYNVVIFSQKGDANVKYFKNKQKAILVAYRYLKLGFDVMVEDNVTGETFETKLGEGEKLWI